MKSTLLAMVAISFVATASATEPEVPYPTGYRNWNHVKSMVIEQGHPLHESFGGIHHLYANRKAMTGYQRGQFPDGAIIVFDLLEANRSEGAVSEGNRKVIGVMQKQSKKFASTGGWGFEGFATGKRAERIVVGNAATACFACHTSQKDHDFVFSQLRD